MLNKEKIHSKSLEFGEIPKKFHNCYGVEGEPEKAGVPGKQVNPELSKDETKTDTTPEPEKVKFGSKEFFKKYQYWMYGTGAVVAVFVVWKMFGKKAKKA